MVECTCALKGFSVSQKVLDALFISACPDQEFRRSHNE